jgi:signal transduction histidine kinase
MKPLDINKLVVDCVATARKIHQDKEAEFAVEGHIEGQVLADPRRITQVLINLIANGIKYSEPPIKILIRMETRGKEALISVRDNGVGIAPANLGKIFDKYYRTEEGKNKAKGLGLGLFLASEIIKKHHGRIEVRSKVGEGSTFTVHLPILS